ncbi:putative F-box/LRR-repeat protein At3g18150 [Brassica rapa]|uniref:putative F-box/LRR-repeat protein At3g18150 n=1 Tax=Brassica campestris TaxID=3711 RepID=UPI0004F1D0E4|nr:putative F-box/LRR-repeat protein At3g18150 [Brassica rapa]
MANKGRDGDGVDSISSLPDELLQHILSSLKTATAVKTSTLSKRWRHVWSGTPSLYLVWNGHNFKVDSMNKTLARYTAHKMTSFHLYADNINRSIESPDINRSIEFAMSKNVENMLLDIRYYRYNLPEFLYFSSTIKQLTLSVHNYYSDMKVPTSSVSWTSLKKLSLFCCNFSEECMARILSGSPILERLRLDFCSELKVIDVSKSLSLRTLEATISAAGIQIVAPHIRCLRLKSCLYQCTLVDVSSLTEANLEISVMSTEILTDGFPQVIMQKMVEKLQNVETLTFGPNLLKILSVAELHHLPFPSFKVKDLTLETTISQDVIPGLVTVLENSPQLKKLTVQPKLVNGTLLGKSLDDLLDVHGLIYSDQRWRSEAMVFPKILTWDVEPKHVVSFIKLILKTTKTLEKMVLGLGYYLQGRQVEEFLEMVPMLCQDNNVSISNKLNQRGLVSTTVYQVHSGLILGWRKPCPSFVKCNIGSSWLDANRNCGAAWMVRDHMGQPLVHGRRSYSMVASSVEADLLSFRWAIECLATSHFDAVVFESPSYIAGEAILHPESFPQYGAMLNSIRRQLESFRLWSIAFVRKEGNLCVDAIALSVTRDHRYQSYIGRAGPSWLNQLIQAEAAAATNPD